MLIPVEISSFAIDPANGVPLIILREATGGRAVAVPMDPSEMRVVAMHSLQVRVNKPGPIDLLKIVMEQLGGALHRVVISDVEDGFFTACVVLRAPSALKVIDCRASDAVVLAMRCGAPVFVKDAVFEKIGCEKGQTEEERLKSRVRAVDVAEFGKYVLE